MGLTVSRKTAKNLAVMHKNERILTVSCKKNVNRKISSHKIRSRDLLLSLMYICYVFMCSGTQNYNRNRKCRNCQHNLSHSGVAQIDRRFDSSTISQQVLLSFMLTGCNDCIKGDSKCLSRWRKEVYRKT